MSDHPVRTRGAPSEEREGNDGSTLASGSKTLAPSCWQPEPTQKIPFIVALSVSLQSFSVYRFDTSPFCRFVKLPHDNRIIEAS